MDLYAGVDIGGTNIVCGLTDAEGNLICKIKQPTEAHLGSGYVLAKIAKMIDRLLKDAAIEKNSVVAVGVGTPGFVDPNEGISRFAGNLQWRDIDVASTLSSLMQDVPVFIDNDVRMYIYGEAMRGAAQGFEHVLGVTLGTGIAAAVVNKGQLYYGGAFMAGEIGHIRMESVHYKCRCGMTGCLETIVSGTGIVRQMRDRMKRGKSSILQEWFNEDSMDDITATDVSKAYDAGDQAAIEVLNYTGTLLGTGLSYAVTLFSPDIVVIGGGAAMAGERLFAPMREQLKSCVYPAYWERLKITPAFMNDDAGVVGSALHAKQKLMGRP
ncbi:MAG TPA: ROK family protein [Bacilli bacterium]